MNKKRYLITIAVITAILFGMNLSQFLSFGYCYNKPWDQGHVTTNPKDPEDPEDPCEPPCDQCKSKSSPVFLVDGNFVKKVVDFRTPGNMPIVMQRVYQSNDNFRTGYFGYGWIMSLESKALDIHTENEDYVLIIMPNGQRYRFTKNVDGSYSSVNQDMTLTRLPDSSYQLDIQPNKRWLYNSSGLLKKIEDGKGNWIELTYSKGCLSKISNNTNQEVDLVKGANGKIQQVVFNGKVYSYSYDNDGNLISYTDPEGNQTIYQYDNLHNLTAIIDPRGNIIERITYDANNRVHTHEDQNGKYTYTYLSSTQTKITDPGGKDWVYTFDSNGLITNILAPDGTSESRSYDANGNLISFTDRNGNTTIYTYDANGNVLTRTDPLGNVTTFTYDANGRKTSETDPLGNTTSYSYDANGNLTSLTYPNGTIINYSYDANGNLIKVIDPNGNTITYTYDSNGNLLSTTNAAGETIIRTYDDNGNLLTETDPSGSTITYQYDDNNRLVQITDAMGNMTKYEYDVSGNITKLTDARGNVYEFTYDSYNRLTTIKDPLGNHTNITYDNFGRIASQTDPNGNIIYYSYDPNHRSPKVTEIKRKVNGDIITTTIGYDPNGNMTSITDPDGNTSTIGYDALNRKVSVTLPTGETVQYQYDATGNLSKVISPNGAQWSYTYDSIGQVLSISNTTGILVQYQYDALYRKVAEIDASGNRTTFFYDQVGRQIQYVSADGRITEIRYGPDGRIQSFITPDGKTISLQYWPNGRVKSYTDSLGNSYSATYDANGNVTSITDPNGNTIHFTYDALNRKTAEIHPDGSKKEFAYDAVGNLTRITNPDGSFISMTYDGRNKMIRRSYSDSGQPDDIYTYYRNGLLKSATKGSWSVKYVYDSSGRLLKEDQNGKVITYLWDIPNRTKTITYPCGKQITLQYDTLIRQTSILDSAGNHIADFTWSLDGVLTNLSYLNGVQGTMKADANSRIAEIAYNKGGLDFIKLQYIYNDNGKIILERNLTDTTRSREFGYDARDRLISYKVGTDDGTHVIIPSRTIVYTLDPLSNWLSNFDNGVMKTFTVNNLNQYTSVDGTLLNYSLNGELVGDGTNNYIYDELGRLLKITRISDGGIVATYSYDALGRRIAKNTSSGTVYYYYDSSLHVIEERDNYDNTIATYVYGRGVDRLIQMERDGSVYYYHQDIRGNVLALTDTNGDVVERYQYDPYGSFKVVTPVGTFSVSQVGNPYTFTGRRYDEESGLYYFRNRYYSPTLGRFISRDPLGYSEGLNLFEYASSNPVTRIDPLGLGDESCFPISLGAGIDLGGMGLGKYIEATRVAKKLEEAWKRIANKTGLGKGVNFGLALTGSLECCNKNCCDKSGDTVVVKNIEYFKGTISLEVSASSPRMPLGNLGVVVPVDEDEEAGDSFVGIVWSLGIQAGGQLVIQPVFLKGCVLDYKLSDFCVLVAGWVKIEGGLDVAAIGTGVKGLFAGTLGPSGKVCYGMSGWLLEICLGGDIKVELGVKIFWLKVGEATVTVAEGKICWSKQKGWHDGLTLFGVRII